MGMRMHLAPGGLEIRVPSGPPLNPLAPFKGETQLERSAGDRVFKATRGASSSFGFDTCYSCVASTMSRIAPVTTTAPPVTSRAVPE